MNQSIRETLAEGVHALRPAGIDDPRREAASLLTHVLGVDRAFLIAHPEHELSNDQAQEFQGLVARRAAREPLQYIIGCQEFFKLKFEVTPDVLIPRPETEFIVAAAMELVNPEDAISILEIGTGSGCIVISLLTELKNARAVATDISPKALQVADRNARRHGVNGRLALIQADMFPGFDGQSPFSLVVSNPPYVPAADIEGLQPEVRDHEPRSALVAGADGLSHIRVLLDGAATFLGGGGYLIFEIGFEQRDSVERLIDPAVWKLMEIRKDLQGIPRTVVLQKK